MTTRGSILMLLCATALAGCSKIDINSIAETPMGGARIKFANFGVNAPSVNFYDGTTKVTAVGGSSGKESSLGTAYGRFAAAALYVDITPGQHSFIGTMPATTDTVALKSFGFTAGDTVKAFSISSVSAALATGKFYTLYQSGIYDKTAKAADGFVVEDPLPTSFDWTMAYLRFVNASGNSSPMTLYAKAQDTTVAKTEVAIGGAVAYKSAGAFTPIPVLCYSSQICYASTYDLYARVGTTNAITRTSQSFQAGRYYTITAYGDMTVTGTTAANRPQLDNTTNR